jgi:PAS domain S-box-containing protein
MAMTAEVWHIVIVDDSPDDSAEARRLLLKGSDRRYAFTEAATGAAGIAALRAAAAAPCRCIVLDYNLPDMDAPAFLAAISGSDGAPQWPVVVFTGDDSPETGRRALRAGAHDYIGKSWMTPQGLVRAIENAAERWAMARDLRHETASAQASEQHFQALAEATSDITYRMSADWSTMRPLDGRALVPSSDAPLEDWAWLHQKIPPYEHLRVRQAISEAIAQKTLFVLEHRVLRPDGAVGWASSRAVPILDAHGGISEWFGAASDITQRKAAEEALARSEAFARSVVEASADCMKGLTLDGRLLWMNDNGQRQMEVSDFAALRGGDWLGFWEAGGLRPQAESALAAARAGGVGRFSGHAPTLAGTPRWWDVAVTAIPGADGRAEQLLSVSRDVTAQRSSETALQKSRQDLQTLADNTPEILARFDRQLRHVFVNAAAERVTGLAAAEFLGKTNRELGMPVELCDIWDAAITAVFDKGLAVAREFSYDAAAGVRHFSVMLIPERGPGGEVAHVLGVTRDRTAEKEAQDAMRIADRRKDEFLATLAHELRNPLAPLRTGLQVLRLTTDPAVAARTRFMMERQLGQMVRLIDDLLDVSRITSGKVVLRPERIDLQSAVHTAVEAVRPLLDAAAQVLQLELPAQPIWLQADVTRICQVLNNLLTNAIKYSPPGSTIGLSVHAADVQAVITVSDPGEGIPQNMLTQVFEMFTQVNRTLARAQGGLGIGLALVKRLVEMHGGTVTVESAGLGAGSSFTVRLPTAGDAEGLGSAMTQVEEPLAAAGVRVLVVDDNVDAAESLAELLSLYGHDARVADSGPAALALVREFRPALVLLDIGMPGMNGYETARRIRAEGASASVTLVALTGWGAEADRIKAQEAGFDHHFTKPVDLSKLEGILQLVALRQTGA